MTHNIELPWEEFKSQCLSGSQWKCIYFDFGEQYRLFAKQNSFTVLCKMQKDDGADQVDFETNYKDLITNTFVDNTQTQFERTDIVLKCAKSSAVFSSGEAEISIKVPGTPGSGDGRYVAGGYAFTDLFSFGDKMKSISIVDVDNILGYGAHTVIQTYHDADVDEVNKGWFMWPSHSVSGSASGEIEIDPLGYYGFIPSGLYLEIYFECSLATNVYCDIWWGQSVV
jgi:hypothetical protein